MSVHSTCQFERRDLCNDTRLDILHFDVEARIVGEGGTRIRDWRLRRNEAVREVGAQGNGKVCIGRWRWVAAVDVEQWFRVWYVDSWRPWGKRCG
jgi:hypothetical protein